MPITSTHNARLKAIRKLRMRRREREREGRFVAEGEDLLAAADAAGWQAEERFVASGSGLAGTEVEPRLLESASGLASGTRALAVYRERWLEAPIGPCCVYLHGVLDPGNVGTILRGAEAFGAASLALGPGCADPYSPKAVRASMGAVFAVPLVRVADAATLPGTRIALVPGAGVALRELPELAEATVLIGAERAGLPAELVAQADLTAHIPIASHSLNAAMAASVALYELARRMPGAA
jgi:TrmH family RNA methyltransferase